MEIAKQMNEADGTKPPPHPKMQPGLSQPY